ncbi:MAG: BMP family ABC transporter substrate-binding protein [Tissierellia bacterium]|nr:BMP family ABC transporter substrate-binding protein [Tissierellia bacterium]
MSLEHYGIARSIGMQTYRLAVEKGQYPFIPALDEMLKGGPLLDERSLGTIDVPLCRVVGTKGAGRQNAFAADFMPILPEDTEFAAKWAALYQSQLREGLREPIQCYEYMNRFYVSEGNKRVSVMKSLHAISIRGSVTRLIPIENESKENKIYFEFLDFYDATSLNMIWFSEQGRFKKLVEISGKKWREPWTKEEIQRLKVLYYRFRAFYKELGGDRIHLTTGDAFLIYLEIFSVTHDLDEPFHNLRQDLVHIWSEFQSQSRDDGINLLLEPIDKQWMNTITSWFSISDKAYKIAFIHESTPQSSSWSYQHEMGRLNLEEHYHGQIETSAYAISLEAKDVDKVLERAIEDGNRLIFTTSSTLLHPSVRAAVRHPEVKILNCSINSSYSAIRSYHCRIYEGKFIMGLLAGALGKSNSIGYVAEYPVYGMTANINAFALGVKMVNPAAKVVLKWSKLKDSSLNPSLPCETSFISDQDMITPGDHSMAFGFYHRTEGKVENLAAPLCNWGRFYGKIIESILDRSWKNVNPKGASSHNYWWGFSAGVIDVIFSSRLPEPTKRLAKTMMDAMSREEFQPFAGVLIDQLGNLRLNEGQVMEPMSIIQMDWLMDNVIGFIPTEDEVVEEGRQIVRLQGIR